MNIFIDTSILYRDPFWKGNFYSELIEIVKDRQVNIYISSVVLKELERNFGKIIDGEIVKLKKLQEQIENYQITISSSPTIDKDKSIKNLKEFYDNLIDEEIIEVLEFSNDILPEIVDRAVWRKKPFTETKTELKDTLIWLTYAKYVEENQLNDCIFLSDNISDFCNTDKIKEDIFEIHHDLQKDSKRFKIYRSPKELIQKEKGKLQFANPRFKAWIKDQNFDSAFLQKLIERDYEAEVERKIERKFENYDLYEIFDEEYFLTGYILVRDINIYKVENINVDLFKDECLISADLFISCNVEGYAYNAARDPGEDKHTYYGDRDIDILLTCSFYYDQSEIPRNFDIDYMQLID